MWLNSMRCNNAKSFTLIEIIVVIGIVTVAFISLIALVHRAISLYYNNKNVLIANALAQEGIELARFVRDDNWMTSPTYQPLENYFSYELSLSGDGRRQTAGTKKIFAIDPRIVKNPIAPPANEQLPVFYESLQPSPPVTYRCTADIQECLKDTNARLYKDTSDSTNIVFKHMIDFAPYGEVPNPANQKYIGFNRLILTEYRDSGTPGNNDDDYVHVESWIYWVDHGRDKFFHIDANLYDYSWRYAK